jgi:quinol monooxygenase YgiN
MSKHMMTIYRVLDDKVDEVKTAVAEFVTTVKEKEPKTLYYEVFQGQGDVMFFHIMTFEDGVAEQSHRQTPHMKVFEQKLYPCCEEEPALVELDQVASNVR